MQHELCVSLNVTSVPSIIIHKCHEKQSNNYTAETYYVMTTLHYIEVIIINTAGVHTVAIGCYYNSAWIISSYRFMFMDYQKYR